MKKNTNLVEKNVLVSYARKLNPITTLKHMLCIAKILFEEMYDDLKLGKTIKIKNFGILKLINKNVGEVYYNEELGRTTRKPFGKFLSFRMERKIHLKLINRLDLDTLGKDEQNNSAVAPAHKMD